ncbi:MAG: extracellular solute-binding protein [Salinibacterium sp.]|nr:extracellular solute-binding protein [Salinibacterium sp.]
MSSSPAFSEQRGRTPLGQRESISRRTMLLGSVGTIGAAWLATGLTGCSAIATGGVVPLSFWHLLSGGDGIRMSGLVDRVNSENPDFKATQTVLTWGAPYYTKLAMASAGGRAPEVAIMHASRVPGYAPGGLLDEWDLDMLSENDVTEADFPKLVWDKGVSDGKLYSIALDIHPFILMYDKDIAKDAGVLGSDGTLPPMSSPEEFIEVARAMQLVTGVHGLSYGYLNDGAQLWRLWYTLYLQHGATMELPPGGEVKMDEDAAISASDFMRRLLDGEIATSRGDYATAVAEFVAGGAGMFFTGVWELPTVQGAGMNVGAMPIPTLFGTPAAYADSHSFVLPHQNAPDETKRADTYRFVADMLKNSFDWARAGHVPTYLPVTEDSKYASLDPQADYVDITEIVNYDPVAWFSGSGSDFQNIFGQNVQGVLLSGADPAAGIRGFVQQINTLLSKPSPV